MSLQKIRSILAHQLGYSDETLITPDMSLFDDLQMDGNDFDEVLSIIEETYDLEISEDAIDEFEYVKDLVKFVKNNVES
jgi:acyl carrier protein